MAFGFYLHNLTLIPSMEGYFKHQGAKDFEIEKINEPEQFHGLGVVNYWGRPLN
jgi:hypothetical protein